MKKEDEIMVAQAIAFGLGTLVAKLGIVGTAQNWLAKALVTLDPSCTHAWDILKANEVAAHIRAPIPGGAA